MGLGEVHPFVPLEAEELDTEGLQKQEEEEELGILQYLDQLEQVTARFLSRLVQLVTKNIPVHVRSTCALLFLVKLCVVLIEQDIYSFSFDSSFFTSTTWTCFRV